MIKTRPNHRPPKERIFTPDPDFIKKDYFTVYEVAELLNFHHNTIRKMIKTGELPATRFNGREWRIRKADLENLFTPKEI